MGRVIAFSLSSAANPTLIAATTVMLLFPRPKKLMLGYLAGALTTSLTLGLVIVRTLETSGAVSTAKHTVNPIVDLALGAILLVVAGVLGTDRLDARPEPSRRPPAGSSGWAGAIRRSRSRLGRC
jgi:uncharacterized transporter YbjL